MGFFFFWFIFVYLFSIIIILGGFVFKVLLVHLSLYHLNVSCCSVMEC